MRFSSHSSSYIVPTLLAVGLHAAVFALMMQTWFQSTPEHTRTPRHVQAQIVDLTAINAAKETERKADEARQQADARKKAEAKRQAEAERKRKEQQRKQALAEKQRKADEAKRQAEAKQKAEQKRQQEIARKKAEEQKRKQAAEKAAEKKRQQELARKKAAEEKAAAETKRQQELARKKAAEEKKRQQEARRQAEAERLKAAQQRREQALAEAAAQEAAAEARARAAASYEGYIRDLITRNWRIKSGAKNGMEVAVRVQLLPTGEVVDAFVERSSGDSHFDRSAVQAVLRAERFPELQKLDPIAFDRYYRSFTLKFRPEDLRW
ncbi:cell envelope integrity protein TolA [Marinobacterium arenosum]|uniref:cell envelope integrity protein TolA n=1 Tax=Marinobacterium arenosum TaxID=2862496 RepID=UPI001C9753F1|nr:cell envelope integrity protein TolA [Marinobacterium arenosum]MBY4675293.1 cell envelope integrity protein TolA [Marinobacterium arenosum]